MLMIAVLLAAGCGSRNGKEAGDGVSGDPITATGSDENLRTVSFLPYWVTTVQFAGYYVAAEKGFYARHRIHLNILPYRSTVTPDSLLRQGKADFAALWLVNAIRMKASGTDLVNIAQLSSRSSLMLITKKKSGIAEPEQMNGKRAGIWSGFEMQPRAFFKKYHLDVEIVPIGSTNTLFLLDGVEITNANWFDEYHSIINAGYNPDELNTFFFADYGLNFLEDGIYCMNGLLQKDPGLCRDFVEATLEGWEYAFSHPEETLEIVKRYAIAARQPVNRSHQQWMLDRYRDLYLPKGKTKPATVLAQQDYDFACNVLKESEQISSMPAFADFWKPVIHP